MVDVKPLKQYLEGREALKAGDEKAALKLLANSVGAEEPTPYMKDNLAQLIEPNVPVLTLILEESKGKRRG